MSDLALFRVYEPWECSVTGYPYVWRMLPKDHPALAGLEVPHPAGVKDVVRAQAGHRCVRCGHPFRVGETGEWSETRDAKIHEPWQLSFTAFEELDDGSRWAGMSTVRTLWSPCDRDCCHGGPARARVTPGRPWEVREDASSDELRVALAQGNEVQAAWRVLTTHHLNGRKEDLRWHNLVALCQRCHLHIQRKVVMERVFPYEHSPWFRPYAAGFYASSYLGQNLTRAEVEERMVELLALERAA